VEHGCRECNAGKGNAKIATARQKRAKLLDAAPAGVAAEPRQTLRAITVANSGVDVAYVYH
jgi:hypothetical protein